MSQPYCSSDPYPVHTASRQGYVSGLQQLISEGYSINIGDWDLIRPLHEACFRGHFECVKILLENEAECHKTILVLTMALYVGVDLYPLHTAARAGDYLTLKTLILSGQNVNTGDWYFMRPLHEACLKGFYNCANLLLENGAEVNVRNIDGATPLCDAASSGKVDCVRLLLQYGAQINPPLLLTSPLHEAVMRDHWQCVEILVKHGAKLEVSDCHFGTPLHVAACQGHRHSAEILLKAGAHVNALMIHKTPLHDVARQMDHEFVELLLEFGANVHAQNNHGLKPIDLIPTSTCEAKELLRQWQSSVPPLKFLCRLLIRQCLGSSRIWQMEELNLPKILTDFLNHQ